MEALPEEVQSKIISNGLSLQDLVRLTPDDIAELSSSQNERTQLVEIIDNYKRGQLNAESTVTTSRLICPLCPYQLTSKLGMKLSSYLRHVKEFHSHQPSFQITCGMYGCPRTFKKFSTFRTHVYEHHGGDPMVTNQTHHLEEAVPGAMLQEDDMESDLVAETDMQHQQSDDKDDDAGTNLQGENRQQNSAMTRLQNSAALALLGLKEKHKLTQVATQGIVEDITSLIQIHMEALQQQLQIHGVCHDRLGDLFCEHSQFMDPFTKVKTPAQQLTYYRTHFGMIDPVRVQLGEYFTWKGAGHNRRSTIKVDEFMYVPVLKTLQQLLQDENYLAEIERGHHSTSDYMRDYCDGEQFKKHPLFSLHSDALQIFFYFDDLEVCNPLGSKAKKHKLSMFYFTLGNLPPLSRSRLSSIYLVAISKQKLLRKYGMDAILRPFVEDVKKLEQGYTFCVGGTERTFFGTIALISADNLGSLALGGFKESCSSIRMCRHCMATRSTSKIKFSESDFKIRTPAAHKRHCRKLQRNPAASKKFGINRDSILNELRYFHVCGGGLLPDIMHDVLEGALQLEVKLLLQSMIFEEEYFTLDTFNSRLDNIELGHMEIKDRPTQIAAKTLKSSGSSLKQEAAQMWLLGRILPLLIGHMVPSDDKKWINFLLMMEIVDLLFSPKLTQDQAGYLYVKIIDHHNDFVKLYGNEHAIPKIHFMCHMARLILEFGPIVCYWTIRYEAKHSYFKSLTSSIGNFINLPYTLAMRHQEHQCYIASSVSKNSMTLGRVSEVFTDEFQDVAQQGTSLFETNSVTVEGKTYKKGTAILKSEEEVLIIEKILINGNNIWFKGRCSTISNYHTHFRAYQLTQKDGSHTLMAYSTLPNKVPLHPRKCRGLPGTTIILLPYNLL